MTAESSRLPSPRVAYAQWAADCADAGWHGEPAVEEVPVQAGLGRVTALAVHARWASPRFACAAMDGIAVVSDSLGTGGDVMLPASAFSWVDTGDPLPAGADTVVERERVELFADGGALVTGTVALGRNVRAVGEDFQAGHLLVPGGHRLRPADLGAAAAAGYAALAVARRPVVAIIPTGDEIRPAGSALGPGEFTDSNSVMLAALAARRGAVPMVTGVQPDDPDLLAAAVREAASSADLVLVLAGSSRGRGDYTATVLAQVGGLAVQGVAVRPGHPVLLGHVKPGESGYRPPGPARRSAGTVPAIGVPGYPLAAAVIFELFAAPLLLKLEGQRAADRTALRARLCCDWDSPPGVEDWVPVALEAGPDRADSPVAVPSKGHGAGSVSRLVHADAWWPIPIGQGRFTGGDSIEVLPVGA
jgi:molybdopterin molybdotransferase/putative molybdopterin biosynthesis protein